MFMEWKVCMNVYPINYNLELKLDGPSHIMKQGKSTYAHDQLNIKTNTPAPGNYDPNHNLKYQNISYSIRSKYNIEQDNNKPGPGTYDYINRSSSPGFS